MSRATNLVLTALLAMMPTAVWAAATPSASPATEIIEPAGPARELAWQIVSRRPHDTEAWTQGLQLDGSGRLFESTGLRGRSTLREVDPLSGEILRSVALPDDHFGEGLALAGDRLIQLDKITAEKTGKSMEQVRADWEREVIPLGRYGKPEEFAAAVVFISSAKASYITGLSMQVDGGMLMSMF